MSGPDLTSEQIDRYSRHILLQEVGVAGQRKLLDSSALVVGRPRLSGDSVPRGGRRRSDRRG